MESCVVETWVRRLSVRCSASLSDAKWTQFIHTPLSGLAASAAVSCLLTVFVLTFILLTLTYECAAAQTLAPVLLLLCCCTCAAAPVLCTRLQFCSNHSTVSTVTGLSCCQSKRGWMSSIGFILTVFYVAAEQSFCLISILVLPTLLQVIEPKGGSADSWCVLLFSQDHWTVVHLTHQTHTGWDHFCNLSYSVMFTDSNLIGAWEKSHCVILISWQAGG